MKIAVVGSGLMGSAIGRSWAAAGHAVTFSYSRDTAKLNRLARETGGETAPVADAVKGCEAVLLAVHWSRVEDALSLAGPLDGKVVLNCCVPLNEANDQLVLGPDTSGAEELARLRPTARWVGCFNTIPSETVAKVRDLAPDPAPHVLTYGDDAGAKDLAKTLIRDAGFDPLDAGGLSTGRYAEPFAMVTAVLAYGQPGGPALTYRFQKL